MVEHWCLIPKVHYTEISTRKPLGVDCDIENRGCFKTNGTNFKVKHNMPKHAHITLQRMVVTQVVKR